MKTILICSNLYPPKFVGGAELVAHYQARALQRLGHRVVVFSGDIQEIGDRHQIREDSLDGIPVHRLRLTDPDFDQDFVNFYHIPVEQHFAGILQRYRPDVVHAHNLIGFSTGILSQARAFGARTVVTLHDHWGFCYKNTIIKREGEICRDFSLCHECRSSIGDGRQRNIPIRLRNDFVAVQLEACDYLISPSHYLAAQYARAGFPVGRLRVLWNGIDFDRFSAIRKTPRTDDVRFTFIGYLGPHKGVGVLARAIELLAARTDRFIVNFVGIGELQQSLTDSFAKLGLGARVRFWGRVPNEQIDRVFADTDVQLLPSVWPENQPVSITEAMASRTPVVASALGGTPELVENGRSGWLVAPGDASSLAAAMKTFIDSPDTIARFGIRGFEKIRGCSFDAQVRKLLRLYDSPPPARAVSRTICIDGERFTPDLVQVVNNMRRVDGGVPARLIMSEWVSAAHQLQHPESLRVEDLDRNVLHAAATSPVPVGRLSAVVG